jgi:hypothetical protein
VVKNLATSFCKVVEKDIVGKFKSKGSMKDKEKKDADDGASRLQERKKRK